ncbi:MAG: TlpA disulfide reductase family protein [Zunongwangia sp.]|uniref:TlpA disulfide reductase family protein n=1 Tax=Zunongwangia sp. TaxID=1965325 RepID=UPI003242C722
MKFIAKITFVFITIVFFSCSRKNEQILQISGNTIGVDSKNIFLVKPNQDTRFDSIIEIPVIDEKFYYETKLKHPEAVMLFLTKDLGRYMPLFLENEKMDLTIYPEDKFDKNIVNGGELNAKYKEYKKSLDLKFSKRLQLLQDSLNIFGEKFRNINYKLDTLNTELERAKNKDDKSSIQIKIKTLKQDIEDIKTKGAEYEKKSEAIYLEQKEFQHEYLKYNQNLISYFFLLQDLISYSAYRDSFSKETIDLDLAKNTLSKLKNSFPNHSYNEMALNLIDAIEKVKVGKKYIDFSAPDLHGNQIKLSDQINGKIALLDLWATWCGPCIRKSRTMVPLYDEFKDKRFTIVGVAGEFKNTDRLVKFLEKEKWEWTNLIELDRKNNIWQKYGVDGRGGAIFLIDENGIILAKDPTAEEVRAELETRLK